MRQFISAIAARLPHQPHDWLYALTGILLVEIYDEETGAQLL